MKALAICTALLLCVSTSFGIKVPQSTIPVKTDENSLTEFVRVSPDDKALEKLLTKAWLWQDGDYLVAHVESAIDKDFKSGAIGPRDQYPTADYIRIHLVTIPDAYYAYYYMAFPTGSLVDGVRNSDLYMSSEWDSRYSYETASNDTLWTVTMRIPLTELRFKQKLPYRWKIILTKYNHEAKESYSVPYINTKMGNDYFLKAQDIELNHLITQKVDLTFRSYFVKSYDLIAKTGSFDPDHLGLDVAFNPGQRTRIKLTMNPDYSDIPPDNAQDNYNSKYPPYLGENRFFFTEDIDVLGVESNTFYSRNIVQPRLAFKMTGNSKILNWGLLGAFDKEIRGEGYIINPDDYYQVLAFVPSWRKFRSSNLLVSRVNAGYYNHVGSSGFRWEILPKVFLNSSLTASVRKNENEADSSALYGYMTHISLAAKPGNLSCSADYSMSSRDLRTDAGFYADTDWDSISGQLYWNSEDSKNYLESFRISAWGGYNRLFLSTTPIGSYHSGANAWLSFRPKFSFSGSGNKGTDLDLSNAKHDTDHLSLSFSFHSWDAMGVSCGVGRSHSLIYDLYDTRLGMNYYSFFWGALTKKLRYSASVRGRDYDYPKVNVVIVGGDTLTVKLDNRYAIANASLAYTPSQKLQLSSGIGISTYERAGSFADLSYYTNIRYEFMKDYFIYAGFKSNQTMDEESNYSDPMGHFRKNSASAYAKLAVTF
ncbi:MAG: hypothetical protein Q8M98_03670 [Candidatus Cloacimonadaceae bacterium]|nr:hypothetical protein [Candidatus Cloacimonadaceae bacterium]MDP3113855.1 hypothetical protein [Candidatus Cloacimonadaceae bacterium]